MFQGIFKHVSRRFHGCLEEVSGMRVLDGCVKGIFQNFTGFFEEILKMLQKDSMVFQEIFSIFKGIRMI